MTGTQQVTDPLAPVRTALVEQARAEADRILAAAEEEAAGTLAEARREAEAIRDEARRQGAADAETVLVAERARARRRARAVVLAAERAVYDETRRQLAAAVLALRDAADYPQLRETLAAAARGAMGDGAELSEHPSGGVVATRDGRRAVCSLDALADRVAEALASELEGLWSR